MKKALLLIGILFWTLGHDVLAQTSKPARDCFAEEVIYARQGLNQVGGPVDPARSNPDLALGEPYKNINGEYSDAFESFYSLGFGGEIILRTNPIANEAGPDFYINEATFQRDCSVHPETIQVYASQDNIQYTYLGEGCQDDEFDLTGADGTLAWAQYFRIVDVSNPDDFPVEKNIDGYDIDGLVCLSNAPTASTYGIAPFVNCVTDNGDGTLTASFGYENPNTVEISIPEGTDNRLSLAGLTVDLPESFLPGRQDNVFEATFATSLTWTVGGRSATANAATTACTTTGATAAISGENLLCPGSGDEGTITVALTGTAPWDITIQRAQNGSTSEIVVEDIATSPYTFSTSEEGVYSLVSVSNANGEGTVSGFGTVAYYNEASAMLTGGQAIYCGAASDFEVVLSGIPPFSFTYTDGSSQFTINNISQRSYTFSVNDPGTYSLVSMQDANCEGSVSGQATVQVLDPTARISGGETIFCDETATITVQLTGTQPYTFTYSDGTDATTVSGVEEDTYTFQVSEAGTYSLVSFSAAGCAGVVSGQAEIMSSSPSASISGTTDVCNGSNGSFTVNLAGRTPFSFVYSDGTTQKTVSAINANTYTVSGLAAGTYTLVSMEDAGCTGSASGTATIEEVSPSVTINAPEESCEGETISLSISGEGSPATIMWTTNGAGTLSATDQAAVTYTPAADETGLVTFSVEADFDCTVKTDQVQVDILPAPDAGFTASAEEVLTGEEVVFTPDNNDADSYVYDYGDGTTDNTGAHGYDVAGVYQVTLSATTGNCTSTSTLVITVDAAEGILYVPNVFDPTSTNPDNQVVKVYGSVSDQDFTFEIYNRWGDLLWSTSSFNEANTNGWDGMANGRLQANGVYTYVLRGRMADGDAFEKTGTITLIR